MRLVQARGEPVSRRPVGLVRSSAGEPPVLRHELGRAGIPLSQESGDLPRRGIRPRRATQEISCRKIRGKDMCGRRPARPAAGARKDAGQTQTTQDPRPFRVTDLSDRRPRRGLIAQRSSRTMPSPVLLSSCSTVTEPRSLQVFPERPRICDVRRTKMIFVILVAFVLRDGLFLE